ncbi:two-component system, chemotaxis family, sensor kinase CheA, partial [Bradyrhizobium sp. Rc3b]|uniref:Hpt domain-containing protein n=1 Tax=Bradyrhizobium sp. Rc3b TaxID=1855322 RepID=UPI0008EBA2A7
MDDLLREFLTETSESLDTVDNQLVKFEQEPNNAKILDNIFRLVHTIKGTCGFLGLPRLEALAHAGETLMGKFRDGMPVTGQAVTVILSSIDRIKEILAGLEATEAEPEGNDRDLIDKLEAMVEQGMAAMSGSAQPMPAAGTAAPVTEAPPLVPEAPVAAAAPANMTTGSLIDQTLERPLRPGEVSLDELERAFRETAIEAPTSAPVAKAEAKAEPVPAVEAPAPAAKEAKPAKEKAAPKKSMADEGACEGDRIANQSIRVNVDTLEHLMTMVSELVLTRNQLLEISRRNED